MMDPKDPTKSKPKKAQRFLQRLKGSLRSDKPSDTALKAEENSVGKQLARNGTSYASGQPRKVAEVLERRLSPFNTSIDINQSINPSKTPERKSLLGFTVLGSGQINEGSKEVLPNPSSNSSNASALSPILDSNKGSPSNMGSGGHVKALTSKTPQSKSHSWMMHADYYSSSGTQRGEASYAMKQLRPTTTTDDSILANIKATTTTAPSQPWILHGSYYDGVFAKAIESPDTKKDSFTTSKFAGNPQASATIYHSPHEAFLSGGEPTTEGKTDVEATLKVLANQDSKETRSRDELNKKLHAAAANDNRPLVLSLLSSGAGIDSKMGERQETILLKAAKLGNEGMVRLLLGIASNRAANDSGTGQSIQPPDPDARDVDGWTVLDWAVVRHHRGIVAMLIEVVTDIEATDPDDGWTVLHRAVFRDHYQIVKLLLEKGANVNAHDHKFWTPLHRAAFAGNTISALQLLKKGAYVGAVDQNGQTPLHLAANAGHYQIVLDLLKYHADVDAKDGDRRTPLDLATKKFQSDKTIAPLLEALRKAKARKDGVDYKPLSLNYSPRRAWEPARPGDGPHREGDNMPSYLVKKGLQPEPDISDPSYWD